MDLNVTDIEIILPVDGNELFSNGSEVIQGLPFGNPPVVAYPLAQGQHMKTYISSNT
jgi:hypothetical protein